MPGGRMRLSKKTEYALRALIYAARHPEGTTFQIKELAAKEQKIKGRKAHAEDSSPAVARLVRETSEAIQAVLDRWTLADLAREEQEAAERRQRNVTYFI